MEKNYLLKKFFMVILLCLSLFGGSALGIRLSSVTISFYRIFLAVTFFIFFIIDKAFFHNRVDTKKISNKYLLFIAIWVIYSLFQFYYLKNYDKWEKYFFVLFSEFILYYLIVNYVNSKEVFKNIIDCMTCVIMCILFLGVYETFSGNYLYPLESENSYYVYCLQVKNIFGNYLPMIHFGNPNNLALFCIMSLLIVMLCFYNAKKMLLKIISITTLALLIFTIISTDSRSGIIGMLIFFIVLFFIKKRNPLLTFIFFLCCLTLCIYLFYVDAFSLFEHSGSNVTRINLVLEGFDILFNKSYSFGVGLGNIEDVVLFNGITNIHNWWMEVLVSSGIFIFIAYLLFYLLFMKKTLCYSYKCSKGEAKNTRVIFSFLCAFVIACVGPSSIFQLDFVWSIMGLIIVYISYVDSKENFDYRQASFLSINKNDVKD